MPLHPIDNDDRVRVYELVHGIVAGMTKRHLGNFSPDEECRTNPRTSLRQILGWKADPPIFEIQARTHRADTLFWNNRGDARKHCGGVIWRGPGLGLLFSGGCGALAFHDPVAKLSGILHVSWKTLGGGVVQNFLDTWKCFDGDPVRTSIRLLPAICSRCLTFDIAYWEDHVCLNIQRIGKDPLVFTRSAPDYRMRFDLMGLTAHLLRESHYTVFDDRFICTCHSGEYWCYRCNGSKRNTAFIYSP